MFWQIFVIIIIIVIVIVIIIVNVKSTKIQCRDWQSSIQFHDKRLSLHFYEENDEIKYRFRMSKYYTQDKNKVEKGKPFYINYVTVNINETPLKEVYITLKGKKIITLSNLETFSDPDDYIPDKIESFPNRKDLDKGNVSLVAEFNNGDTMKQKCTQNILYAFQDYKINNK